MDETAAVISLSILSIIAFPLNCFCIYIIITNTKFREKPSAALIVNLLFTHVFQAVFVFPLYAGKKLPTDNIFLAQFYANGFRVSYILSFYGGCLCVLNIAIDRFLATYLLTKYRIYATFKNIMLAIGLKWLYVVLICMIPFIPSSDHQNDSSNSVTNGVLANTSFMKPTTVPFDKEMRNRIRQKKENANSMIPVAESPNLSEKIISINYDKINRIPTKKIKENPRIQQSTKLIAPTSTKTFSSGKFYYYVPQKEWTIFMLFFNAALPLIIITLCYMYIVNRLRELNRFHIKNQFENESNPPKIKEFDKYKEVTNLTCILIVTYTLCWTPSIIYYTVLNVCQEKCFVENWDNSALEKYIVFTIKYISFLNSIFSPLIYCFHRPEIQSRILKFKHLFSRREDTTPKKTVAIKDITSYNMTVPVYQTYTNTELH